MKICLRLRLNLEGNKAWYVPILIGAENRVKEQLKKIGLDENYKIEIVNFQREGQLERDVDRLVRNDRIAWVLQ